MLVRRLTEQDLDIYWALRLRALIDSPEAFAATYEDTLARGKDSMLQRLIGSDNSFTLGAFEGDMVGTVRFHREESAKERHIAFIYGTYVIPESAATE